MQSQLERPAFQAGPIGCEIRRGRQFAECGVTTARNPARVEVEVQLFSLAPNLPGMCRNENTREPQKLVE